MRGKSAGEKRRFVVLTMLCMVVLFTTTATTRSVIFRMEVVGGWDNGIPNKFGYILSVTLVVFILKLGLLLFDARARRERDQEAEDKLSQLGYTGTGLSPITPVCKKPTCAQHLCDSIMPWVMVVICAFLDFVSIMAASQGLIYGAPISVFVVFKSAKTAFYAILARLILRRQLNYSQWFGVLCLILALPLAVVAECKNEISLISEDIQSDSPLPEQLQLVAPGFLLLSELALAAVLVLQEISVREYWSDPLALVGSSAAVSIAMTGVAMFHTRHFWVTLPDGTQRPEDDTMDTLYMVATNPCFMVATVTCAASHFSQDVVHIFQARHLSIFARGLCDAVKLIAVWCLGKVFWYFELGPFLHETWHEGLVGSWLMLPAIATIAYASSVLKTGVLCTFGWSRQAGLTATLDKARAGIKVNLEEPFLLSMFTSSKLQRRTYARSQRKRKLKHAATSAV